MPDLDKNKYRFDENSSTLYTTDKDNIGVITGVLNEETGMLKITIPSQN